MPSDQLRWGDRHPVHRLDPRDHRLPTLKRFSGTDRTVSTTARADRSRSRPLHACPRRRALDGRRSPRPDSASELLMTRSKLSYSLVVDGPQAARSAHVQGSRSRNRSRSYAEDRAIEVPFAVSGQDSPMSLPARDPEIDLRINLESVRDEMPGAIRGSGPELLI